MGWPPGGVVIPSVFGRKAADGWDCTWWWEARRDLSKEELWNAAQAARLRCFGEGIKSEIACFHSKAALVSAVAFRFVLTALACCPIQLELVAGWHWEASDSHLRDLLQVFICLWSSCGCQWMVMCLLYWLQNSSSPHQGLDVIPYVYTGQHRKSQLFAFWVLS